MYIYGGLIENENGFIEEPPRGLYVLNMLTMSWSVMETMVLYEYILLCSFSLDLRRYGLLKASCMLHKYNLISYIKLTKFYTGFHMCILLLTFQLNYAYQI